eukprot:jgi/Psemu1/30616/gm1.30616_g
MALELTLLGYYYDNYLTPNYNNPALLGEEDKKRRDHRTPRIAIKQYSQSAFMYLYRSGNDQALLNCCGVDHVVFRELLDIFEPLFNSHTVDKKTGSIQKFKEYNEQNFMCRREFDATGCLALILFWLQTRGSAARAVAIAFGLTASPMYRWLKFRRKLLLSALQDHPAAKVCLPNEEETQQYIDAIAAKSINNKGQQDKATPTFTPSTSYSKQTIFVSTGITPYIGTCQLQVVHELLTTVPSDMTPPGTPKGNGGDSDDKEGQINLPTFDASMKQIIVSIFLVNEKKTVYYASHSSKEDYTSGHDSSMLCLNTNLHKNLPTQMETAAYKPPFLDLDLQKKELKWKNVKSYTYDAFISCTRTLEQLRYESWCRKSHNETLFTPLKNNSRFEHWLIGFKAKLEAHDIDTTAFLDKSWPPVALQGFKRDLFVKQCAFFWVLMLEVFKNNLSSSCVHSHSNKRDGCQAYFDFVSLHSKSKAKVYDTLTQLQTLLNLNIHHWKESNLQPPTRPLEYYTVKSALCQACSVSFQLSEQFAKITDPPDSNDVGTYIQAEAEATHQLKISLLLEATLLDSQALLLAPKSTVRAHLHNFSTEESDTLVHNQKDYSLPIKFEGDFQDYAVFKAGRTPNPTTRFPGVIWKTLSRQGMKGWLNIPADDKKKLAACLRSELLPERQHDPNNTKPISRKAYTHNHSVTFFDNELAPKIDDSTGPSVDLHSAVENNRCGLFHASLGVYKSQTSSTKDQRPLKSSVSPAHPARFLAENPDVLYKKDGKTYVPVGKSSMLVNFHKWYQPEGDISPENDGNISVYTYCTNKTSVSEPGFAMVNQGANECIIGNDACLISKDTPPRYVNGTDINNHQQPMNYPKHHTVSHNYLLTADELYSRTEDECKKQATYHATETKETQLQTSQQSRAQHSTQNAIGKFAGLDLSVRHERHRIDQVIDHKTPISQHKPMKMLTDLEREDFESTLPADSIKWTPYASSDDMLVEDKLENCLLDVTLSVDVYTVHGLQFFIRLVAHPVLNQLSYLRWEAESIANIFGILWIDETDCVAYQQAYQKATEIQATDNTPI